MGDDGSGAHNLVQRDREMEILRSGFAAAVLGRGRLYLLSGVPGVGKTRLLEQVAALASAHDARALWARCDASDASLAFAPWVQILRPLIARPAPMDRYVLNAVSEVVAEGGRAAIPAGAERLVLIDAIASFVRAAAGERPLVLLLDDLQHASLPALLVLEVLVRALAETPVLVVGAYQETTPPMTGDLGERLGELARHSTTIPLRELDAAGTHEMVTALLGHAPSARLAANVHATAGGNPSFVEQLVRRMAPDVSDASADPSVALLPGRDELREGVRSWLSVLPADSRSALALAAIIGREFDAEVVAIAGGKTVSETRAVLASATAAGLIHENEGGRLFFKHGVVHDTLTLDLAEADRRALHDAVGSALERRHASRLDAIVPALAHHFSHGSHATNPARAIAYLRRAGEQALDHLAYQRAARYFEQALLVLDSLASAKTSERVELLLMLASALLRAGDIERANQAVREAADEARRLGSVALLANAALTMRRSDNERPHAELVALLQEAHAALADGEPALCARIEARLARELAFGGDRDESDALSRRAVSRARQLDDVSTLAQTLAMRYNILGDPSQDEERLALSAELFDRAQTLADRELLMAARRCRVVDFLTLGDGAALVAEVRAARRVAESIQQPESLWWCYLWRSMRATLAGNFGRGKRLTAEAHVVGTRVRPRSARMALALQTMVRLWQQGESVRLGAQADGFVAEHGDAYPESAAGRIWAQANGERWGDAARGLAALTAADLRGMMLTRSGGCAIALLAEAAALLREPGKAAMLYERLLPYAGRVLALGPAIVCLGPADRYLGMLATLRQEWDSAESHFARSLEVSRHLGAPPFVVRTQLNHAEMLCARARSADGGRAMLMLGQALAGAHRFGMTQVVRAVRDLQTRLIASAPASVAAPAGPPSVPTLARDTDHWAFWYGGTICRVRHRVGMSYLSILLARPSESIAVLDLVRAAERLPAGGAQSESGLRLPASERARASVTRALRSAIRRISLVDPQLGRHLEQRIKTGRTCRYDPPAGLTWTVATST